MSYTLKYISLTEVGRSSRVLLSRLLIVGISSFVLVSSHKKLDFGESMLVRKVEIWKTYPVFLPKNVYLS